MTDKDYTSTLPLERTWLADIVEAFLNRPDGIAQVEGVLNYLIKNTKRELGKEGESTITRRINDFCENAGDRERTVEHKLFRRVAPGEYKLLTFPDRPDLIEIQSIRFSDRAFSVTWDKFVELAKKNPRWKELSNRERLNHFGRSLEEKQYWSDLLESNKRIQTFDLDDLGL